jgi:hypothetical protein
VDGKTDLDVTTYRVAVPLDVCEGGGLRLRIGASRRRAGSTGKQVLQIRAALAVGGSQLPEAPKRGGGSQPDLGLAGLARPGQSGAEIAALAVEPS